MHNSRGFAAGVMLPAARISALFGASIAIMLVVSGWQTSPALAGTIAVLSCKSPTSGAPEPIEDWKSYWTGAAFPDAGTVNRCDTTGTGLEAYVADSEPQPGSDGPGWEYTTPTGDEILGGSVAAAMYRGSGGGYIGAAGILGPQYEFTDQIAAAEWAPEGTDTTYTLNGHQGTHIWTYAFCEPPGETCATGASNESDWALTDLTAADIELSNNSTPTGTGFGGAPAGTGAISGTQSLVFQAGDSGSSAPGVYTVKGTLDGQSIYDATPNTNEGKCVALGSYEGGPVKEFAYPEPCKSSESVTIPVNSATVKDGTHELVVTVIDAAGNESVVYSHALTSDNAPVVLATPAVSGVAELGSTLTATNGTFSAPEGAGALSSAVGQWLRCSDLAATHCSPIAEATGVTYQPKADDVGYFLVYANTVSDNDGATTSDSQPTTAVTAASAAPSCVSGECLHGGNGGTGGNGGAGGTGSSGGQGAGSSGTPSGGSSSGSGVTVNLSTPITGANQTLLGSAARWAVSLKVSPAHVYKGKKVKLGGVVSTTPRPVAGKLLYLQARSVTYKWVRRDGKRRRVPTDGRWITFEHLRTTANGGWKAGYKFHLGGHHVYQMQAVAPQEGGYQDPTGTSNIVTITET